jgi:TPP-dependent pyruvate/acetoin dehydrogenase alpha subunit
LEAWSKRDPISRYRLWLNEQRLLDEDGVKAIDQEAEQLVENMRTRLRAITPRPAGEVIFGRVYEDPPASFLEERAEFESSLESS